MNPYRIDTPALISVSGGRTSAFMLRSIIDAFGGSLPSDVVPIFCNTGLEHEATLQFVRELSERWVPIVWLEYVNTGNAATFRVVDYCSASRKGEPFAQLIASRKFLPFPRARFCTTELKIRTGNRYAASLGWQEFTRAVGLRFGRSRVRDCQEPQAESPWRSRPIHQIGGAATSSLVMGGLIEDDSMIDDLRIKRGETVKDGRVHVSIHQMAKEAQ